MDEMPIRIRLYQYPEFEGLPSISPPCMKVGLVLRRMGLPYEAVDVTSPREARRRSPTGRLPAVDIDGVHLCDSMAILDHLENRFPDRAIGPRDPRAQVLDRLWESFATDSLYWLTYHLRWCVDASSRAAADRIASTRWFIGRVVFPLVILPGFRKRARLQGVGGRSEKDVTADFERAVDLIDSGLEGGPFLGGAAEPGRGDIALGVQLLVVGYAGGIASALDAITRRPAVTALPGRVLAACQLTPPEWWPGGSSTIV